MKNKLFILVLNIFVLLFTFNMETKALSKEYTFSYTGDYQEFIAPFNSTYKLEVWGAEGGTSYDSSLGGKGGYSSGYYYLKSGDKLYVYVGEKGKTITSGSIAMGFNGGGSGKVGTGNKNTASGGGATDIRLAKGDWNNAYSLNSRIIVAGGGGGAGIYYGNLNSDNSGGAGGGTAGVNGVSSLSGTNYIGTGANQTNAGSGYHSTNNGGIGYGGTGTSDVSSGGGGGGGYYGGGGAYCGGGGGGSGYIGGVVSYNDIAPLTIDGNNDMPTHDGTGLMQGNTGNGFAKISFKLPIVLEADNLDFTVSPTDSNTYEVTIPSEEYKTELRTIVDNIIWSSGLGEVTLKNNVAHEVILMKDNGEIFIYNVIPNLGKAKLKNVLYTDLEFDPNIYNYKLNVANSVKTFTPEVEVTDGISYRIINADLTVGKNNVLIEAYKEGMQTTTYNFEITREIEISSDTTASTTFSYTGNYQEFIAPYTGTYLLEVWGAEGGTSYSASTGGKGGYSKGYYYLKKDEKLYVYVGAKGRVVTSKTDNLGVYNGGGAGKVGNGNTYAATGGGATDIRLVSGEWNNTDSLKSRIIVAGAGGGGGSHYSAPNSNDLGGGVGGGLSGAQGRSTWGASYISYPGTQTAGGAGANNGTLGTGGAGAAQSSSGGGGGGGYYGGGGADCGGGAGGSGYIGKVTNLGNNEAITLAGDKEIPTHDGLGTMTGNSGDGYAKISYFNPDELDAIVNIGVDKGTLNPEFNPLVYEYDLTLTAEENILTISGETLKKEGLITGLGTYEVEAGETTYAISFINTDGSVTIYNINATRLASSSASLKGFRVNGKLYDIEENVTTYDIEIPTDVFKINLELIKLYSGQTVPTNTIYDFTEEDLTKTVIVLAEENLANEVYTFNFHRKRTSQLKSLNIKKGGSLKETFKSDLFDYTVKMVKGERTLDIEAIPWFQDAVITMNEPRYISENDKQVTIKVDLDGLSSTTYTLNIERVDEVNTSESIDFLHTGDYQEWIAPYTGTYLLEVWGAEGGSAGSTSVGGKGGYSKGYYYFEGGDKAYIYVGGMGKTSISNTIAGGFNGGGLGKVGTGGRSTGSGGGATDIRLIKGAWNNLDSLKSRIIVAGGGGGAGIYYGSNGNSGGGYGGGLSGGNGYSGALSSYYIGTPGTQTQAGSGPQSANVGGLGFGGKATSDVSSGGGGGGGYYGGGGGYCAGGGGGSSFIKGLLSCDGDAPITIAGNAQVPTYDATGTMLGNSGNGHAKITAKEVIMGDAFLDNIILNDGDIKIDFEPWTLEYNVAIPKGEVDLKIEAIAKDAKAKITGVGIIEFAPGETKHEIIVSNEGTIKKYILNVTREPLSDATPKNITLKTSHDYLCSVTNGICDYTFAKDTTLYNVIVPFQTENVTLKATLESKWQKVIYRKIEGTNKVEVTNPTFELKNGINTFEVEIISEDETESTIYTYNISRDDNGNNSLSKLEVTNPTGINLNFNPYVYEYSITIPYTSDFITLNYEPANLNAIVNIYNDKDLKVGMNDVFVTVTAPNNTSRTYIIHTFREQSSNTFLSSLEVKNRDNNEVLELTPTFNKTILDYMVKVDATVNNVTINAIAEEGTVMGNGDYSLNSGNNHFEIIVTSVAGDVETYNIDIFKDRSNNSNLLNIEVEGYTLDKTFNKDIKDYTVTIPKDVTSVKVNVTPESDKATYTIRGNNNLNNNINTIVITSIAEDKSYQVYTITVNKQVSDNNYLSDIKVIGGTLNETFNKEDLNYTINVDGSVDKIEVRGILEDTSAKVTGNGIYALVKGENIINLVVTSAVGNTRTYTITVNKALNNDVTLKAVNNNRFSEAIKNEDITKNYDYLINVQYEINSIDIEGIANALTSKVTGNGTYSLVTGDNDITLRVTAEDSSYKDYIVRVVRDKSDNDDLSFLYVHEGGIKPDFYETTILYEVKVPNNTNTLHIEAVTEDKNASVDITGATLNDNIFEVDISEIEANTPKDIDVVVTAENGHIKIYTITVIKQDVSTENLALLKLETNRGELTPIFNSDVTNYELEVENNITDITITGEVMDSSVADVVGLGTKNLKVGKNLIEVFVISKETSIEKSYQIVVTRKASSDASLASLVVKGHVLNPAFDKDTLEYTLKTTLEKLEFTTIKPVEADATYEVIGNRDFVTGENIVTIRVTAPDEVTTKDYVLKVEKQGSKNNNLASLEVVGYTLVPKFHKGVTFYAVEVNNNVNSIVIDAKAEDNNASISGNGLQKVITGENYFDVIVTSEEGTKKVYTILVTKEASDNNYLASLNVSDGTLNPEFNKETLDYEVIVPYDISKITINGTLEDENARTNSFGEYNLDFGDNNILIVVTSESGVIKTYNIKVIREEIVSAYLTNLEVKGYELDSEFNKEILEYYVNVDSEVTSLDLSYVLEDKNAKAVVTGNENFEVGMNEVKIEVTASDNITTLEYIIYVNRAMSTNNYLASLITSEGILNPVFDPKTLEYTIEVAREIDSIDIIATTEDSSARITSGVGTKSLNIGDNEVLIKVKSSIGITRTYKLNIVRKPATNNFLKDLTVKDQSVSLELVPEFDKLVNTYEVNAGSTHDFVNIRGVLEDENATVSGLGIKELKKGLNTFDIVVVAEDGSINTYTLNIMKEASSNNYLNSLVPSVGTLNPEFTKENQKYFLDLTNEQSDLGFIATLEDNKATVAGLESKNVAEGISVRNITVTAEDGSVKVYEVTINKETVSIALLDSLEVEHYPFEFDSNTYTYTIRTSVSKKKLLESEITAIPKDENATVNMMGDLDLTLGIVNIYTIEVIAKDGYTTQEYILNIIPDETSEYSLKSKIYDINRNNEEDYVIGIMPSTNIDDFKLNFDNEQELLHVYMNNVEASGLTATAMEIRLEKDGFIYDKLRVIVRGDLTSDGRVNVTDQVKLINYVGKVGTLDKYQMLAADLTFDSRVNVTDQVKLINYVGKVITNQDLNPKKEEEGS